MAIWTIELDIDDQPSGLGLLPDDWFYPDMTDTQKRVDNHHLTEVSHVPEKTLLT